MSTSELHSRFVSLVDEHRKVLYKVAGTYARTAVDRQDLVQEMVAQLWRSFDRYDPNYRFSTWMYRVALNVAISYFRTESRNARRLVAVEDVHFEIAIAPTDSDELEAALQALWRTIDGLDALDRALVVLYLDGQSHEAIAEVLAISRTNVGTKINRIKKRLRGDMASAD